MRYRIGENPTLTAYGTTGDFIVLSAVIGLVEARGGRSCSGGSFALEWRPRETWQWLFVWETQTFPDRILQLALSPSRGNFNE